MYFLILTKHGAQYNNNSIKHNFIIYYLLCVKLCMNKSLLKRHYWHLDDWFFVNLTYANLSNSNRENKVKNSEKFSTAIKNVTNNLIRYVLNKDLY